MVIELYLKSAFFGDSGQRKIPEEHRSYIAAKD